MAKRMKFSVVGLPHYTVWHMYEPSVDDLRHMEEMEKERKAREKEEKERQDRLKKIQNEFTEPASQWEKDKTAMAERARASSAAVAAAEAMKGDEQGPMAGGKESATATITEAAKEEATH